MQYFPMETILACNQKGGRGRASAPMGSPYFLRVHPCLMLYTTLISSEIRLTGSPRSIYGGHGARDASLPASGSSRLYRQSGSCDSARSGHDWEPAFFDGPGPADHCEQEGKCRRADPLAFKYQIFNFFISDLYPGDKAKQSIINFRRILSQNVIWQNFRHAINCS